MKEINAYLIFMEIAVKLCNFTPGLWAPNFT
jgi:hypothetical protein